MNNLTAAIYGVVITAENGKLSGKVTALSSGNVSSFDPETVLCDLLKTVEYREVSCYVQDNYVFRGDFIKHPFFIDDGLIKAIVTGFPQPDRFTLFYNAIYDLRGIMASNRKITLSQFEVQKQFYGLKFSSKIEFAVENPLYKGSDLYKQLDGKHNFNNNPEEEFQYEQLSYNADYDLDDMFKHYENSSLRFTYTCYSLEDVIFAVFQFLLLSKYKFAKCNHCDNYFATKTLKQKYCKRNSPYEGYGHLDCEQAVRNIKQKLARRRKTILSYFGNYYSLARSQFDIEYDVLKDSVDLCSSVDNLQKLEVFLSKDNVKARWYKKEYRIKQSNT